MFPPYAVDLLRVRQPAGMEMFNRSRVELDQLLGQLRLGRGASLILRGEAGVEKTTLLNQAVEAAGDLRVFGCSAWRQRETSPSTLSTSCVGNWIVWSRCRAPRPTLCGPRSLR